jgi:16S rRNA G966 N2-methylase RsmD
VPYEAAAILEAAGREAGMRLLVEINRRALDLIEAPGASVAPGTPTRRVNLGVYLYIEDEPASGDRT